MEFSRILTSFVLVALVAGCAATETRRSTGQVLDDTAISTQLKTRLLADSLTDGLDIEIEVNRGRVQLIGFADSDAERARAGEIARSIRGVTSVDNQLQVATGSRTPGEYVDDKVLVARVKTALTKDARVKARDIEIEANRGVVALGGFVDNRESRTTAANITATVAGVRRVVNNLQVR